MISFYFKTNNILNHSAKMTYFINSIYQNKTEIIDFFREIIKYRFFAFLFLFWYAEKMILCRTEILLYNFLFAEKNQRNILFKLFSESL